MYPFTVIGDKVQVEFREYLILFSVEFSSYRSLE
jgi:hypothetical protein